jgi:hypothetical protein
MNADQIIAEFRVIPATAQGLSELALGSAYIDGELCALRDDGTTSFSAIQAGTDSRSSRSLIYFAFDLLFLDGTSLMRLSLIERKTRLESVLAGAPAAIRFSEHELGRIGRVVPTPFFLQRVLISLSWTPYRNATARMDSGAVFPAIAVRHASKAMSI